LKLNYVDTSVFVAAFTQEQQTQRAERWLTSSSDLTISDWTITEFSSAIAMKLRVGSVDLETRTAALDAFAVLTAESLTLLAVERGHFREAALFADRYELGLRAPDALHLAIAADDGATVVTLDRRLATAGKKLGVPTRLL
jgi:predicted nucleic acid-binding protein